MSIPESGGPTYPGGQRHGDAHGSTYATAPGRPGPMPEYRADSQQPPIEHPAAPQPARQEFDVVPVRRCDVRRLQQAGPPRGVYLPPRHGSKQDPRYPSPHSWRTTIGLAIDLVLHVGCAVGVMLALTHLPRLAHFASSPLLAAVGTYLALSIVHRIVVQWACQTTLGKALCGVCLIRDDSGGRPTMSSLVMAWLLGAFTVVSMLE